jgi:hypothetical protein
MATLHTMDWAGLYVGANAGSYESVQMTVVARDPSADMVWQRPIRIGAGVLARPNRFRSAAVV